MAEFYSARGWEIPPLPWTNLSPPFSWEIGAVENIHGALPYIRFAPILALVGVGVNRIGKIYSMTDEEITAGVGALAIAYAENEKKLSLLMERIRSAGLDLSDLAAKLTWTHPGKVEAPYTVCIASASNLTGLVKSRVECRRTGL